MIIQSRLGAEIENQFESLTKSQSFMSSTSTGLQSRPRPVHAANTTHIIVIAIGIHCPEAEKSRHVKGHQSHYDSSALSRLSMNNRNHPNEHLWLHLRGVDPSTQSVYSTWQRGSIKVERVLSWAKRRIHKDRDLPT